MSEKLLIFENPNFDNSIVREEIHTYHPPIKSFDNNDEIEITINQQDVLVSMYESALYIEGNIEHSSTGKGITKITNNMGAFLFDYISYELNGIEIDRVRDPGITTLLKAYLSLNENECKALQIAGFIYPLDGDLYTLHDNSFSLRIPLSYLFGIFNDYRRIIRGRHKLRLVRARADNNCYQVVLNELEKQH